MCAADLHQMRMDGFQIPDSVYHTLGEATSPNVVRAICEHAREQARRVGRVDQAQQDLEHYESLQEVADEIARWEM